MANKVLKTKFDEGLLDYEREISEYRDFTDKDVLDFIGVFFSEDLIKGIKEMFDLQPISFLDSMKGIRFVSIGNGLVTIDFNNPTPKANSLKESINQLLNFIPYMHNHIGKPMSFPQFPNYKMSSKNGRAIALSFFARYDKLTYDIKVEGVTLIELKDSSKDEFLGKAKIFMDELKGIKAVDQETKILINNVKVDLGALIRTVETEDKFDFKNKFDRFKDVAEKTKPFIE